LVLFSSEKEQFSVLRKRSKKLLCHLPALKGGRVAQKLDCSDKAGMTDVGAVLFYHPGLGWLVSAVVHAVIYGAIFRIMHHLTLTQAIIVLVIVLGGAALWMRSRGRSW
jgi:hypothetical protein